MWSQSLPPWASSTNLPPSQPWRSSPTPPPIQWNLSRSAFGDYRPNLDTLNQPRPESPFQYNQSPFTEADQDALDTIMGLLSSGVPDTPTEWVETSAPARGGGGRGGGGGGRGGGGGGGGGGGSGNGGSRGSGSGGGGSGSCVGSGGGEGSGVGGSGGFGFNRGKFYTKDEHIAVARAWDAITSDPVVGTDQPEGSFWRRVMIAYEDFKPHGADKRDPEQLRKKWGH
ncbi:translation initiation factor IF-2-like [Salvia splendens]|uniref:translation initiation factor IF-2-like n=1 Tax=Salvia splendens TaxID=180675 RepID=UPI001C257B14|nr:translation initiation factor IF-2-like [Salvia splendens]